MTENMWQVKILQLQNGLLDVLVGFGRCFTFHPIGFYMWITLKHLLLLHCDMYKLVGTGYYYYDWSDDNHVHTFINKEFKRLIDGYMSVINWLLLK